MQESFHNLETELNNYFVERQDEIHGLSLGLLSGTNVLFLGSPGIAKSFLVNTYASLIKGCNYFSWLLTRFSTPEELLGPFSLAKLEEDRYIRTTTGKLPEAHIAFIDETWKGNSGILNCLLTLMNERIFYNDGKAVPVPLLSLIGASNELPESGDGLEAMLDRFTLKYLVSPIREASGFARMIGSPHVPDLRPMLDLETIMTSRHSVTKILVDKHMIELLVTLRETLNKDGIMVSDRTYVFSKRILQTEAFFQKRDAVQEEDFDVLQHCLWAEPENRKRIYSHILNLTNPEKSKILALYEDSEEIYNSVMELDDKDPQRLKDGVEVAVKLKDAKKKMHEFYVSLKSKGKNTSEVRRYEAKLDEFLTNVYNEACGVKFT